MHFYIIKVSKNERKILDYSEVSYTNHYWSEGNIMFGTKNMLNKALNILGRQ